MNIDKIAKKISASKRINIKNLLYMDIDVQIIYPYDNSFSIEYSGPVELTQDGFIRWSSNGTFDVQLVINGYQASIINVLNHEQIKNVCALFNTINGNVNEDTYKKYIRRNENV